MKASGPPHVSRLWLRVSEDMLSVEYCHSNKSLSVIFECNGDHNKADVNLATLSFEDIIRSKTVLCLSIKKQYCIHCA